MPKIQLDEANPGYRAYLKSEHWAQMKSIHKTFRKQQCWICWHHSNGLHLHHLHYRKPLHEMTLDDVVGVCPGCHKAAHLLAKADNLTILEATQALRQRYLALRRSNQTHKSARKKIRRKARPPHPGFADRLGAKKIRYNQSGRLDTERRVQATS